MQIPIFSDYIMAQTSWQFIFVELPKFQPATQILNRDRLNIVFVEKANMNALKTRGIVLSPIWHCTA